MGKTVDPGLILHLSCEPDCGGDPLRPLGAPADVTLQGLNANLRRRWGREKQSIASGDSLSMHQGRELEGEPASGWDEWFTFLPPRRGGDSQLPGRTDGHLSP